MKESEVDGIVTFNEIENSLKCYVSNERKRDRLLNKLNNKYIDAKIIMYKKTIGVILVDKNYRMFFSYAQMQPGDRFDFHRGVVIAVCKILNPKRKI